MYLSIPHNGMNDIVNNNTFIMPIFHSVISLPLAKNFDKEIIFLHSFAAEEICSPATVA